jgi:hypothetical protein
LGTVPINMALRENCDSGEPAANFIAGGVLAEELTGFVRNFAGQVSVRTLGAEAAPTLTIS